MRRRSRGWASVFHRVRVVAPMVTRSPMFTSFRSWIFRPFTCTPDLEPVSPDKPALVPAQQHRVVPAGGGVRQVDVAAFAAADGVLPVQHGEPRARGLVPQHDHGVPAALALFKGGVAPPHHIKGQQAAQWPAESAEPWATPPTAETPSIIISKKLILSRPEVPGSFPFLQGTVSPLVLWIIRFGQEARTMERGYT